MKRFNIIQKATGNILDFGNFSSLEDAMTWFTPIINKGHYGQKEVSEVEEVIDPETLEVITPHQAKIEAEFSIEEDLDFPLELAKQEAERVKSLRLQAGAKARQTCTNVLDLISGENLEKELTLEQISDLQLLFGNIEKALQSSRPTLAKMLILAVEPDEVLITQELKDSCLELLADY